MTAPAVDRPLRRMLDVARPWWGEVLVGAIAGAVTIACGIGLLAASAWLIARAAQHPNEASLAVAVVVVRACGVGRGLLRYAERLLTHDAAFRVLAELRVRVWERLAVAMPAGLGGLRSGDLLTRMISDVDGVQDLLVRGVTPPLIAFLTGGATVVGICVVSAPSAAVLGTGLLAAALLVPMLAVCTTTAAADAVARDRGELASRVTDVVDGCAELVAYGVDAEALRSAADVDDRLLRAARRSSWSTGLTSSLTSLVTGATVWLLLALAAPANPISAAVVVLTGLAAFEATGPLAAAAQQLAAVRASSRRVLQLLNAPDAVPAGPHPLPAAPAGGHRIELVDASVRFRPVGPWALRDVDLVLSPGRRVALIGPSGSGKSTVASLLLRLRDPDRGRVLLDGVPLTDLDPDDVRTVVAGCTSDAYVFDSTLRENLRLARPSARQDELDDAARRVRLLDWIEAQPAEWDTRVGAHGTLLSGGERQRLLLARALLADPPVLVLDEPTAHLDPATRDEVLRDLLAATVGRTVLLITHDDAGLDAMDEVVRLADGRVVAVSRS